MSAHKRNHLLLVVELALAYILHQDLWLWNDARMLLGLPIGLVYHLGFTVAVSGLMLLLVKFAWPSDPPSPGEDGR